MRKGDYIVVIELPLPMPRSHTSYQQPRHLSTWHTSNGWHLKQLFLAEDACGVAILARGDVRVDRYIFASCPTISVAQNRGRFFIYGRQVVSAPMALRRAGYTGKWRRVIRDFIASLPCLTLMGLPRDNASQQIRQPCPLQDGPRRGA